MDAILMILRDEKPSDIEAIFELTRTAFAGRPYSANTEQFIVDALRAADALTLSLVAESEGIVVGHVAFSPVTISDGSTGWYGLGPISVLPERQKQGIGKALIYEGLERLRARGAKGCILLGDPGYYARFGFRNDPELVLDGVPSMYFQVLPFTDAPARGTVQFHEAFSATSRTESSRTYCESS